MESRKLFDESDHYLMNTYKRFPVIFGKGRGTKLWSGDGKEYLDFLAGIAVNVLGHCHPRHVVAIQKQAQRLIHVSNLYHNEQQIKLAKLLVEHSFADRVFFSNSGAEANEAALKLARKYGKKVFGETSYEIITTLNSFHGRARATLSATGQKRIQKGYDPLLPGFKYVPYDDMGALKEAVDENTCAIMIEPIQGEGGVIVPSPDYLRQARELCDKYGILLILDEVQTGIGRTGKLFAYEHFGIKPDIITLAKALGGGFPIGATLARAEVAKSFEVGSHASTFGGSPLACAAALATVETVLDDGIILSECSRIGIYLRDSLEKLKERFPHLIVDVRGMGLLLGMELSRECDTVVQACFDRGILINSTGDRTIRLCPPLIITVEEIDILIQTFSDVLDRLS